MFHVPEQFRLLTGPYGSNKSYGNNGAFIVKLKNNVRVSVIASDQEGWEHVSVSLQYRCPTWDEMCQIKDIFWDDEDTVLQYHPPKSEYVNNHKYCLHLWRPVGQQFPVPDPIMVGIKI